MTHEAFTEVHTITGTIQELKAIPEYSPRAPMYGLRLRVRGDTPEPGEDRFDASVEIPLEAATRNLRVGARVHISVLLAQPAMNSDE